MSAFNTRYLQNSEASLLAIDLGLADLFDDNVEGCQKWLNEGRIEFDGATAKQHIQNAILDVVRKLNDARGLY